MKVIFTSGQSLIDSYNAVANAFFENRKECFLTNSSGNVEMECDRNRLFAEYGYSIMFSIVASLHDVLMHENSFSQSAAESLVGFVTKTLFTMQFLQLSFGLFTHSESDMVPSNRWQCQPSHQVEVISFSMSICKSLRDHFQFSSSFNDTSLLYISMQMFNQHICQLIARLPVHAGSGNSIKDLWRNAFVDSFQSVRACETLTELCWLKGQKWSESCEDMGTAALLFEFLSNSIHCCQDNDMPSLYEWNTSTLCAILVDELQQTEAIDKLLTRIVWEYVSKDPNKPPTYPSIDSNKKGTFHQMLQI